MAFIKLNPRTLLLFITTTAISLGVVCGDVGKLRGQANQPSKEQLSKGLKYVAKVNEQKILITPKDEPSQINANDEEAPIIIPADRTGMSPDDIRSSIRKSFDVVLNQKKSDDVLNSMTDMDKHMQHLFDNFDTVLNHQGRTDWGYTGMSNEEIDQLRTRIFQSRVELQAKLQQGIVIEDSLKLDLDAVKEKFDQDAHNAMDALEDYEDDEDEDENAVYLFSSSDEERQHREQEDCAYKFRNEESLDFFSKSKKGEENICESSVTIVSKSDIDDRALIADGQCNFDPTHGYWYVAECRPPSTTSELPQFVMTKAFCHGGCNLCSDPHKLPNILGIPTGPVYRTWNGSSRGVCELPPVTPNLEGNIDSLWVQHEGNCIQDTCVNKHK